MTNEKVISWPICNVYFFNQN